MITETKPTINDAIELYHKLHSEFSDMLEEYLEAVEPADDMGFITDEYANNVLNALQSLETCLKAIGGAE